MRIPVEHFSTTPVFALSPCDEGKRPHQNGPAPHFPQQQQQQTVNPNNLGPTSLLNPQVREKKHSLPDNLGLLTCNSLQSVGSAPSSPTQDRKDLPVPAGSNGGVPTISSVVGHAGSNAPGAPGVFGPVSLPQVMHPYATLPKK